MAGSEYIPASAMVVVAHPDDAEFLAAGTIAKWAAGGAEITLVVVTKGDKGSDDPSMTPERLTAIREAEQRAAGAVLGIKSFEFLGYADGYLQPTLALRRDLSRMIRKHRPDALITFDPMNRYVSDMYINHPDHRAAGDAALDAVYPTARDRLTFPELLAEGYEPHKVKQLWMGSPVQANTWVDIAPFMEQKKNALRAHPSQIGEEMIGFVEEMGRWDGAESDGIAFAEGFHVIVIERQEEVLKDTSSTAG